VIRVARKVQPFLNGRLRSSPVEPDAVVEADPTGSSRRS
jgi:hypothetical protein